MYYAMYAICRIMWNMCAYVTPFKPHIIAHLTQRRLHYEKYLVKLLVFIKNLHTFILGKDFIDSVFKKMAVKDSNEILLS